MQERFKSNALPAVMLVIIVFWALSAVLMLTSTLASADKIDKRVKVITNDAGPIDQELDTVPVLTEVSKTAEEIRAAAAPLTGQIGTVVDNVHSIDASAKNILVSATQINGWVKQINTSANEINGSVHSINGSAATIDSSAKSINGSVHEIDGSFTGVVNDVLDIKTRIVRASNQVDVLVNQIKGIKNDTGTISPLVDQINANATGIRNSPVVLNPANAAVMQQVLAESLLAPPGTPAGLPILPGLEAFQLPAVPQLPLVPLDTQLPLLGGLSLLDTSFLGDLGNLTQLVSGAPR